MQKQQIGGQFNQIQSDSQSIGRNNSPSKVKRIKKQKRQSKEVAKQGKKNNRDQILHVLTIQPLCYSTITHKVGDVYNLIITQQSKQCQQFMQQCKKRINKIRIARGVHENNVKLKKDYQYKSNNQFVKYNLAHKLVSEPEIYTFQNKNRQLHVQIIQGLEQSHDFLIYKQSCQIKNYANQLRFYLICIGKALTWLNDVHIVYNNLLTKDFKVYKSDLDGKYYYRLPYQFVNSYVSSQDQVIFQPGLKKILQQQYKELFQSIKYGKPQKQQQREQIEQKFKNPHKYSQPDEYVCQIFKQFKIKTIKQLIKQKADKPFQKYLQKMKIIYSRKDVLHFGIKMLRLTCPEQHLNILQFINNRMFSQKQHSEQYYKIYVQVYKLIKNTKWQVVNFFNQTAIDLSDMEDKTEKDNTQNGFNDKSLEEFKEFLLILILKCINPKMKMSSSELSQQLDKMWNESYKSKEDQTNYR